MKLFNKTLLAMSFSVLGAMSSMSAIAMKGDVEHEQNVDIRIERTDGAAVVVKTNGEVFDFEIPENTIKDKEKLNELLKDLPDDIREDLVNTLSQSHFNDENVKVFVTGDGNEKINWVSDNGGERVIIMELDDNQKTHKAKRVIKHGKHKVMQFKHEGKMDAKMLVKLIENGSFSADELNTIQQALDAKR